MKARQLLLIVLPISLLLMLPHDSGMQRVEAQELEPPNDTHVSFDPSSFQRGQPLPGADYPWSPIADNRAMDQTVTTLSAGIDLDVTYIARTPMYNAYCVWYADGIPSLCPGTESEKRWPDPGEVVTFTAHIINKGTVDSPSFAYTWFIDGTEVATGTHGGLAPGAEGTATLPWSWTHTMDGERVADDHTVRFAADPDALIAETYETNNSLEDRTNALSLRIAITPAMYEAYNTPWDPAFSYSAEDWLQRQIAAMNWALANSVYPTTPQGATERVRIGAIEITSGSPMNDGTHDGGWFVDADYRIYSGGYDPSTDIDWNLVHELSHQVGLIDLYNLDIPVTSVNVFDRDGIPANIGFMWPRRDLMGGGDIAPHTDHHLYSSHSAKGISSTKGYRRGYYGEYQFDIPQQVYLLILDAQGNPASDVAVALHQRTGPSNWMGDLEIDNVPEISGVTGPDGHFLLTNRAAGGGTTTRTGHTLQDNPFGIVDVVGKQNRFLLKLTKDDHEEFAWLDITAFNLAYWQGSTLSHTFTITSHVPPSGAPTSPPTTTVQVEGSQATLCWGTSPSEETIGYHVYRAAPLVYAYERVSGLLTETCYQDTYSEGNRVYAVTAVAADGRESAFSSFAWAPRLINPHAVGIAADGTRVILDPQNGYALLWQRSDGRYIQNFGSPHYHLEYSTFLSIDGQDHLLISHPGDYYIGRHSVRVADHEAAPILEFGEQGSGPAQFQTPAGVVAWGQPCGAKGPYVDDAQTLLLLHFDGSYTGTQGEPGAPGETDFTTGKYGQGVSIDTDDALTYPAAGNLNRTQGAIEFWIRPTWNGGDGQSYTFFEIGNGWFNRMRIMKDGANNLRFMLWDSTTEYGIAYNVGHWGADEWHHIAATWSGPDIALYTDGQQRASRSDANPPDVLADTLYIGASLWHDQQANAVIDELRISDIPRIGNSDSCTYRILVADSGNHRIQAFDAQGTFVSAFGSFGSGTDQFDTPQGLAVDSSGRIIVADSGNHRLQILSFDSTDFTFVRSITAGFSYPTGVATYVPNRIIAADTGNHAIKILDTLGNLLAEYTAPNDDYTGDFNQPRGVVVDPNGNIVVADTGNQRVVTLAGALPLQRLFIPLILRAY